MRSRSLYYKSRDNDLTTDEKRLVPWATEVAELHEARRNGARFDEKRFGELREAKERETPLTEVVSEVRGRTGSRP